MIKRIIPVCVLLITASLLLWGATVIGVDADNRDAYFDNNAEYLEFGNTLYIGNNGTPNNLQGGLEFQITGPVSGDIIDSAVLSVVRSNSGPTTIRVYGADVDNAAVFNAGHTHMAIDHFGAFTTAYVEWTITTAAGYQDSPDVKTVMQQIINRAGFASGNYIGFILDGANATNGEFIGIADYTYGAGSSVAKLTYSYTVASTGGHRTVVVF